MWDLTAFCAGARARARGIDHRYNPFHVRSLYYHRSWLAGWVFLQQTWKAEKPQ